jgi:hypothetical protein
MFGLRPAPLREGLCGILRRHPGFYNVTGRYTFAAYCGEKDASTHKPKLSWFVRPTPRGAVRLRTQCK